MASYTASEKAHLLHLCAVHGITVNRCAPYNSWPRVVEAMIAEAPRHHEGGDLFDGDRWPVRRYTVMNTGRVCRQWLNVRHPPMRNADPNAREDGVDMGRMRMGFVLNEQPEPPANIEADNGTPPPPHIRLPDPQLPSLRDVLSMPNNHPQPILNMNTRLVLNRPGQADGRHRLPDGPVNRGPDAA